MPSRKQRDVAVLIGRLTAHDQCPSARAIAAMATMPRSSTSVIVDIGSLRTVPRQAQRICWRRRKAAITPRLLKPISRIAARLVWNGASRNR